MVKRDTDIHDFIEWFDRNHGYAAGFNHKNLLEKQQVERKVANEWCEAMRYEFDVSIGDPTLSRDDPPDFWVKIDGKRSAVEIVQFVSEENLGRAARGENPRIGALFKDCQWTAEGFRQKLDDIIKKKGSLYLRSGVPIDVLVIMCVEPWLYPWHANEWLRGYQASRPESIKAACMMFRYQPGRGTDTWPLHWVFGSTWPRR